MKMHLLILALLFSCTKELKYSKEQLFSIAKAGEPSLTFILPKSINDGVHCKDYSEGCLSGHIVNVRGLNMIAVEFMTEAEAVIAAKKIRGYQVRNWVFDDTVGEPVLEKFVIEVLKAKKF